MSVSTEHEHWDRLVIIVAEIGLVDRDGVHPESRLIEDLGLDSLMIVELGLEAMTAFGLSEESLDLDGRIWSNCTVGDLHQLAVQSGTPRG